VDDENNKVFLGCVAHRIRGKVEIVEVMSRLQFSILASFVPNEPFGSGLGGVG